MSSMTLVGEFDVIMKYQTSNESVKKESVNLIPEFLELHDVSIFDNDVILVTILG